MLSLDLGQIRTPEQHIDQVYEPDVFPPDDHGDYRVVGQTTLGFDIFKDKAQFRLTGKVRSTLELPCSRCLEAFTMPVDASFDLRYHPHTENAGEGEKEVEEDDLTTSFYENDTLDLGHLMREQFYLALPMKPLCSDACLGLCPLCGSNRNRNTCDCKPAWEDPRLAALKNLKVDHQGHKGH